MCLINDGKHVVGSLDGISYKSGVFDDENMVLRVRNDGSLVCDICTMVEPWNSMTVSETS